MWQVRIWDRPRKLMCLAQDVQVIMGEEEKGRQASVSHSLYAWYENLTCDGLYVKMRQSMSFTNK